ncbi:MAG: 50S ribosomal protein L24 [Saprospiraceae bacterium]|nr:50S ribosomal protein L24 [Saprospiraceae bacterium]
MARKKTNNKRVKLHIKKDDRVMVMTGESKGAIGVVTKIFPDTQRAIVEGEEIKKVKRHVRPSAESPGGIFEKELPIHVSNLMLVGSDDQPSKVKVKREKVDGKTKLTRILKKTQEVID